MDVFGLDSGESRGAAAVPGPLLRAASSDSAVGLSLDGDDDSRGAAAHGGRDSSDDESDGGESSFAESPAPLMQATGPAIIPLSQAIVAKIEAKAKEKNAAAARRRGVRFAEPESSSSDDESVTVPICPPTVPGLSSGDEPPGGAGAVVFTGGAGTGGMRRNAAGGSGARLDRMERVTSSGSVSGLSALTAATAATTATSAVSTADMATPRLNLTHEQLKYRRVSERSAAAVASMAPAASRPDAPDTDDMLRRISVVLLQHLQRGERAAAELAAANAMAAAAVAAAAGDGIGGGGSNALSPLAIASGSAGVGAVAGAGPESYSFLAGATVGAGAVGQSGIAAAALGSRLSPATLQQRAAALKARRTAYHQQGVVTVDSVVTDWASLLQRALVSMFLLPCCRRSADAATGAAGKPGLAGSLNDSSASGSGRGRALSNSSSDDDAWSSSQSHAPSWAGDGTGASSAGRAVPADPITDAYTRADRCWKGAACAPCRWLSTAGDSATVGGPYAADDSDDDDDRGDYQYDDAGHHDDDMTGRRVDGRAGAAAAAAPSAAAAGGAFASPSRRSIFAPSPPGPTGTPGPGHASAGAAPGTGTGTGSAAATPIAIAAGAGGGGAHRGIPGGHGYGHGHGPSHAGEVGEDGLALGLGGAAGAGAGFALGMAAASPRTAFFSMPGPAESPTARFRLGALAGGAAGQAQAPGGHTAAAAHAQAGGHAGYIPPLEGFPAGVAAPSLASGYPSAAPFGAVHGAGMERTLALAPIAAGGHDGLSASTTAASLASSGPPPEALYDEEVEGDVFHEARYLRPQYLLSQARTCSTLAPLAADGSAAAALRRVRYTFDIPSSATIFDYMRRLFTACKLTAESSIVCLVYVERLLESQSGRVFLRCHNWRTIVLCGLLLASKVWDDLNSWSVEFAAIYPQFTVHAVNTLERHFVSRIGFNLYISGSVYARYYFALRSLNEQRSFRQRYMNMVQQRAAPVQIVKKIEQKTKEMKTALYSRSL